MWLRSKKYDLKKWLSDHTSHIIATISTICLAAILVYLGSQALANFIDREFIQPGIYTEKLN